MRRQVVIHLTIVLTVALGLRLAAAWAWQSRLDDRFGFGDSESYWVLGRATSEGGPYQYGTDKVFRTPGYPVLLAPIFWLGGPEPPVIWARVQTAVFGTLSVVCLLALAQLLFDEPTALVSACVAAVFPGAVVTSALVLTEAPFTPLMLLHLVLWITAWRAKTYGRAWILGVLAGLIAGVATLVRPSWLLFTPFALAIALVLGRRRIRHLGIGMAMILGLSLAMSPWWIRNWRVTGRFVPTTLQLGASLYDGLNPQADGSSDMAFVSSFVEAERRDPAGAGGAPTDCFEYRLDRRMRAAAMTWARQNPGRVARLAAVKFVRMWNVWPNEPSLSTWPARVVVLLSYLPVLVLAMIGAIKTIGRGWPYALCWLPAVYFTLLHVIFVASIRYRQPAMLPLIVLAAGAVVMHWRCRRD
jgi:4-amino-4-deoxy-L-arabinose transferase-like glycosyltransferase